MKYQKRLEQFIDCEFEGSLYFRYEIHLDRQSKGYEYYTVTVTTAYGRKKDLRFKVAEGMIFVYLGKDEYEACDSYGWTAKYFWKALLSWEI